MELEKFSPWNYLLWASISFFFSYLFSTFYTRLVNLIWKEELFYVKEEKKLHPPHLTENNVSILMTAQANH